LLPQPPKVGPFALGKPGLLESAIEKSGLKVVRDVEVPCDFVYPDVEDFWHTFSSAGPSRAAIANVGEEKTKQTAIGFSQTLRQTERLSASEKHLARRHT
jgi:hypothetical protein